MQWHLNPVASRLVCIALLCGAVGAQSLTHQVGTLHPSSAFKDDGVGYGMAVEGSTVVVGMPGDDDIASNAGAAAVFHEVAGVWSEQTILRPASLTGLARFGRSIDIAGDLMIIGAPGDTAGAVLAGSAFVYRRVGGTWVEGPNLRSSLPTTAASFGTAVSISGATVAFGAYGQNVAGNSYQGAVVLFVFDGANWTEQAFLTDSQGEAHDHFGAAVALDGDTLAVGAPHDDNNAGFQAGSVRIFTRSQGLWTEGPLISPPNLVAGERFGTSVALQDGVLVVGSPRHDTPAGSWVGRVLVFEESGGAWLPSQTLVAAEGLPEEQFGEALALHDGRLVVSAPYVDADDSTLPAGAAYLFEDTGAGFVQTDRFQAAETDHDDLFGFSVAIDAQRIAIGATQDDDVWFNTGAGYLFDIVPSPWTDVGGGKPGTGGVTSNLGGSGLLIAGTDAAFHLTGGPANGAAHLVLGALFFNAPFKGGTLVPSPDVLALGLPLDGNGALDLPFTWLPGVPIGTPFWTQSWLPDAGATFGLSASNGLRGEAQ